MDDFMKIYLASEVMKNQNNNRDFNTAVMGYMSQGYTYPQAHAQATRDFAPTPAQRARAARKKETAQIISGWLSIFTIIGFVVASFDFKAGFTILLPLMLAWFCYWVWKD